MENPTLTLTRVALESVLANLKYISDLDRQEIINLSRLCDSFKARANWQKQGIPFASVANSFIDGYEELTFKRPNAVSSTITSRRHAGYVLCKGENEILYVNPNTHVVSFDLSCLGCKYKRADKISFNDAWVFDEKMLETLAERES